MSKSARELRVEVFEMVGLDVEPDQYGNISKSDWKRLHDRLDELTE